MVFFPPSHRNESEDRWEKVEGKKKDTFSELEKFGGC